MTNDNILLTTAVGSFGKPDYLQKARNQNARGKLSNAELVELDVILPTGRLSVYDFAVAPVDLVPSEAEAEAFIREVERRYADPAVLEQEIARWWEV